MISIKGFWAVFLRAISTLSRAGSMPTIFALGNREAK
jgi:hypothetical protein